MQSFPYRTDHFYSSHVTLTALSQLSSLLSFSHIKKTWQDWQILGSMRICLCRVYIIANTLRKHGGFLCQCLITAASILSDWVWAMGKKCERELEIECRKRVSFSLQYGISKDVKSETVLQYKTVILIFIRTYNDPQKYMDI